MRRLHESTSSFFLKQIGLTATLQIISLGFANMISEADGQLKPFAGFEIHVKRWNSSKSRTQVLILTYLTK